MNDAVSVTLSAHRCILEHFFFTWWKDKSQVGHTVAARRETIYSEVDYPWGPPISGPIYFTTVPPSLSP